MSRQMLTEGEIRTRFADVIDIWEAAMDKGGLDYSCLTEEEAMSLVYRLNRYRQYTRDKDPQRVTVMDLFIIRKPRGSTLISIIRRPTFDLSRARTLDGKPIEPRPLHDPKLRPSTPAEVASAAAAYERTLRDLGITPTDESADPAEPALKEFDPSRPMLDVDSIVERKDK